MGTMLRTLLFTTCLASHGLAAAQPQAVEAIAVGPREVRVFWNPLVGARRYEVLRDGGRIGEVDSAATHYTDTAIVPDRSYRYEVVAIDSAGNRSVGRAYSERTFPQLRPTVDCNVLV